MKIRICEKCKTKEVINELKKISGLELKIECINYCGIGKDKYVAIIDNKPIIASSKEEFLSKIKKDR